MKCGDVHWADLDPPRGTEPGKTRPVLVVQTDLLNDVGHLSTIVAMLTTHVLTRPDPLRVHVPKGAGGLEHASDVLVEQIHSIDNRRIQNPIGKLPSDIMEEVGIKLRRVLDLV